MKFQINDKVVPISKTVPGYGELNESNNWKYALQNRRPYLFIAYFCKDTNAYVCSREANSKWGDYFNAADLIPYQITSDDEYYFIRGAD